MTVTSLFLNNDNATAFQQIVETIGNASLGLHISGENGLGKEAIVRLLYARSHYRGYPFIKVNCPVLNVPDASSDQPCIGEVTSPTANSSFSLFRLFHQGVLYLHAVDELAEELQTRLLTLIRRKAVSSGFPMGRSTKGMLILSTSSRSLEACVADGTFNPALGELLSGLSIHIPPLRHSPERIGPLIGYFLSNRLHEWGANRSRPSVSQMARMQAYPWPGNIKELFGVVQRAAHGGDWEAVVRTLEHKEREMTDYTAINLTPDGVALMPDFEITQGRLFHSLSERLPDDEMGLMDLLIYEEVISNNKMH